MTKKEKRTVKIFLAAYLYVHHTEDAMEICSLLGILPKTLDEYVKSSYWTQSLNMWGNSKNGIPTGEKYEYQVRKSRGSKGYKKEKPNLYQQQGGKCAGCQDQLGERHLTIDHIVSLADGGTHDTENLQLLCYSCNSLKGSESDESLREKLVLMGIVLD